MAPYLIVIQDDSSKASAAMRNSMVNRNAPGAWRRPFGSTPDEWKTETAMHVIGDLLRES